MSSTTAIALSGMNAAQASLQGSAQRIAHLGMASLGRQRAVASAMPSGGVTTAEARPTEPGDSEVADVVGLLQAKNAFLANLAVFRTADRMTGALLDRAA